jgi:hypothetical protein
MELSELVYALRHHDPLAARQWVADASRAGLKLSELSEPNGLDATDLAIAAGMVELLASRWHQDPPAWTSGVAAAPHPVFLVQAAARLPRLRKTCETEGPEPLRRRRLLAPPDFLTAA